MPVPRSLLLTATLAATLSFSACGSSPSETGSAPAGSTTPTAAAAAAPATTAAKPFTCPLTDTSVLTAAFPDPVATGTTASSCTYAESKEEGAPQITFSQASASDLGMTGDLPTTYLTMRSTNKKVAEHYDTLTDLGTDAFAASGLAPVSYAKVIWVQNGGYNVLFFTRFDDSTAARKKAAKQLKTIAREVSAKL